MKQTPDDAQQLIYEALTQLGWEADAHQIAERVRRLNLGLPQEDEFSVVCTWLGRCKLVHKLDQKQAPGSSREKFQVPDLLALFQVDVRPIPVLVEVKSNRDNTLSFQPDYFDRLRRYSDVVGLPLLIAWKRLGMWTLFEISHLRKAQQNFNITFELALRENLLGVLGADFSYSLSQGAGVHFRFRKEELLEETKTGEGSEQQWKAVCDDVFFTDGSGKERRDLESSIQALFLAWDLSKEEKHSPSHIVMSYVARGNFALFAHMALVHLLHWERPSGENINWRSVLGQSQILKGVGEFTTSINAALKQDIVHHVIHQIPCTAPSFLKAS